MFEFDNLACEADLGRAFRDPKPSASNCLANPRKTTSDVAAGDDTVENHEQRTHGAANKCRELAI